MSSDITRGRVSFEDSKPPPQAHPPLDGGYRSRDDYFSARGGGLDGQDSGPVTSPMSISSRRQASPLAIRIPPPASRADTALTALQYLPMPVLVLSSMKTVVLANEAMGRLFGIDPDIVYEEELGEDVSTPQSPKDNAISMSATDVLYGNTLAQLGLDLLQGGNAVFVAWEDFLGTIVDDASRAQCSSTCLNTFHGKQTDKNLTPTEKGRHARSSSTGTNASRMSGAHTSRTEVHDAIVDVIFSSRRDPRTGLPLSSRTEHSEHIQSQMIVSVWATEEEQYFTLTFTAANSDHSNSSSETSSIKTTARTVTRSATTYSNSVLSGLSSNSSTDSPLQSGTTKAKMLSPPTSGIASPSAMPMHNLLPKGPPPKTTLASAPSMFTKSNRLKEALLNSMSIPAYALWKDESFGIPNKAAIKLIYPWIEDGKFDSNEQARDFLQRYVLYREDFSEEIPFEEFPIMRLMKEQESFENYRVGMYSVKDGSRVLFDTSGEILRDEKGEFLGGVVLFHDVTTFTTVINRQQQQNERQFENICNMIPNMIWRTTPEGSHDYYSDRWYTYTGLSVEQSEGEGWLNAFDPDDLKIAEPKWRHSLATGDEYLTEYRCRSASGEWRWMLGRATPMLDENGKIMKWFGTCTDIHENVLEREEAKQTRQRLGRVIEYAKVTLWAVDTDMNLTLTEGNPMSTNTMIGRDKYIGRNVWDIFEEQGRHEERVLYERPINDILAGRLSNDTVETTIESTQRCYRTRLHPIWRQDRAGGIEGSSFIDGVVGISMDVTELKHAANEVEKRNEENARLMAQSVAAKEASKMKSQFLANMSHEIRTPIAGVIGMSELLLDDDSGELTKDQRECAENIQRSANGLLTVINDILDFSKVESGRLDIEEVQFDLSVVIRDVNKMLSFAAERKGLKYVDDIQKLRSWKVMGDPGRLRQVMTNLLTNSIKFTSDGSVTMRVKARKETDDMVEVHFTVEDTGIGIEEEVRRKLFKPFSQADSSTARRFGGTGLGLTISKNLVELMHGEISLESKLGVGTKATFWIPFHKAPYQSTESPLVGLEPIPDRLQSELSVSHPGSENSGPATPSTPKVQHHRAQSTSGIPGYGPWPEGSALDPVLTEEERKKTQILVVEDNAVNQQIALKTIKKLGFPVKAVWNGKEALDYLKAPSEDNPRPDIILMDVQMPILDGYRATHTIRTALPFASDPEVQATPIVAMTASAIQGDREKCEQAGMDDYLAKPVKKPHLERMLIKWAIEGKKKRTDLRKHPNHLLRAHQRPAPPRNKSSFTSNTSSTLQSPQEHLSSELDRLEFAHRAAAQQSVESVSERALRQQQAEEQAIALRDHELIEAGEDPKTKVGRGVEGTQMEENTSALTEQNMQKLAMSDRMQHLRKSEKVMDDNASSAMATIAETTSNGISKPSGGTPRASNG